MDITEQQNTGTLALACSQLQSLREECDLWYNVADMADSMTFDRDDGGTPWNGGFNARTAYSQALNRPSSTACAYITEGQRRIIVARARAFAVSNPYWLAIKNNRITYGVGAGHVYTAIPKSGKTADDDLLDKVTKEIEDFLRVNKYRRRQGEKLTRLDRDGEFFLRKFSGEADGILRVRFVEPLLVQNPPEHDESKGAWFGVQFENEDYETPVGYYIRPVNYDGGDLTYQQNAQWATMVPAEEIQHRTANVDIGSPRGLPLAYALMEPLMRALKTATTMGKLVDFRGKIALIRKRVNAVYDSISPILQRNRAGTTTGAGGLVRNVYQLPDAAIVDTNDQSNYEFPSQNIETDKIVHSLKADLQSAAAAIGVADFMLSADSQGGSFAIGLAKEGPVEKSVKSMQQDLIEDDLEVMEDHLKLAIQKKRLPADVLERVKIDVQAPVVIERNRIQDTQADEILVRSGAMSRETMAMRANLVFEDELQKIKDNPPMEQLMGNGDTRSNQAAKDGKTTGRPFSGDNEPGPKGNVQKQREGLEESSHDAHSQDKPTTEDRAMAATLLTDEWLAKTQKEILALPRTDRPIDPATVSTEYEPGVKGQRLGVVDGQEVWAVDMTAMMVRHDAPDLVCAGNHERWPFVPADRIVVDWSYSAIDKAHCLWHEVVETRLMSVGKWSYARAHRVANAFEQEVILVLRPDLRALKPQS